MIENVNENLKYGSYPQNVDFNDLPIECKQRFFTKRPIDCLNNNNLERLKVRYIEKWLDNIIYKSNPQNSFFDDLTFDGDEMLLARHQLYGIIII